MALRLYNTLSRCKEDFVPLDPARVRMYVCGPTVYDLAHIGNARPVVVFDVLYRLLKSLYPSVTYVRNITDVDDKIINAARDKNIPIDRLTADTAKAFHADMAALGALAPDVEPRATQHIAQMIAMIEKLIASGHAYVAEEPSSSEAVGQRKAHVLFHVPSMPDYGRLANRDRREMIAGARVEVAPYKKDPSDFVLWKPSTPDQPGWDSPWGRGRPGWHIECSAMSETHLGESFDIHGGGLDLIFPHHENEIAQSTCAHHGKPFVRFWMHNGYLTVNGEKMSKSLGNFFTVRDLLAKAPGEAIRLFLLKTHYRAPLDFTEGGLAEAKRELDGFYGALRRSANVEPEKPDDAEVSLRVFQESLCDDLNTPLALSHLHGRANNLNLSLRGENKGQRINQKRDKWLLLHMGQQLGLLQQNPDTWFKWVPEGKKALPDSEVEEMVSRWDTLRKNREFAAADEIRDALLEYKVSVSATPSGPYWRRVN